jgi:hypothetical protein
MNPLKTPHQKLREIAGVSPTMSPGVLKSPGQLLFEESGIMPHYANGGYITPDEMRAMMMVYNHDIPHLSIGGSLSDIYQGLGQDISNFGGNYTQYLDRQKEEQQQADGQPAPKKTAKGGLHSFKDPYKGSLDQFFGRLFGLNNNNPMINYVTQPEQNI